MCSQPIPKPWLPSFRAALLQKSLYFYLPYVRALVPVTDAFVMCQAGSCWRNYTPKVITDLNRITGVTLPYSGELKVVHECIDIKGTNFTGKKQISDF